MPIFAPVLNVCRTWSDDVAAKMTPAQIAQARLMARDWNPTK